MGALWGCEKTEGKRDVVKGTPPASSSPYPRRPVPPSLKKGGGEPTDRLKNAEEAALGLLARRDYSREEMRLKLATRGFPSTEIEDTLRKLEARKILDDFRYARHLAISLAQEKLLGPQRLRQKFFQKGIPADLAQAAMGIAEATFSAKERLRQIMQRKLKGRRLEALTLNEKKKLADALHRKGFLWEDVQATMDESGGSAEE
jgi:regulatory protein